ncbi:MAG: hypothetical protein IH861_07775 [Chloroflexi bacterium]|nr:hypothetical protein [Chloroflexota bacterium]
MEEKRRRLYRAYVDGMPEDDYRRELLAVEARLRGMKDVQMEEVITLGDHVEGLVGAWYHATKEEKRQILVTMLDGVHVDLTSQQVVALAIKPAFKPLFKAWLDNDDEGGNSTKLTLGKIDVVHGDPDRSRTGDLYIDDFNRDKRFNDIQTGSRSAQIMAAALRCQSRVFHQITSTASIGASVRNQPVSLRAMDASMGRYQFTELHCTVESSMAT